MAYAKRKNARAMHVRIPGGTKKTIPATGKVILGVILVATIMVVVAILMAFFSDHERLAKNEFEALASNYYEDYFYEKITDAKALDKYKETGLSVLTLRQLVLHEPSLGGTENVEKYCDLNLSYAKIFPQEPYGKKDYRVEYKYVCDW